MSKILICDICKKKIMTNPFYSFKVPRVMRHTIYKGTAYETGCELNLCSSCWDRIAKELKEANK